MTNSLYETYLQGIIVALFTKTIFQSEVISNTITMTPCRKTVLSLVRWKWLVSLAMMVLAESLLSQKVLAIPISSEFGRAGCTLFVREIHLYLQNAWCDNVCDFDVGARWNICITLSVFAQSFYSKLNIVVKQASIIVSNCLAFVVKVRLWGGKCSEILATIKLLYNPRVNKVFTFTFTTA